MTTSSINSSVRLPGILICEDDEATRNLLAIFLERNDFRAEGVSDGVAACALLETTNYDAVVLDLSLPRISGVEVLQKLRGSRPALLKRVIVVTALPFQLLDGEEHFGDVHSVIEKPFDLHNLLSALIQCTGGDRPFRRVA